jgi:hypothetical protein
MAGEIRLGIFVYRRFGIFSTGYLCGFPILDENAQTTVTGLYITGQAATRDFGPFFGFVRGCVASALIIIAGLQRA